MKKKISKNQPVCLNSPGLSRRAFLKLTGAAVVGAFIAGCGGKTLLEETPFATPAIPTLTPTVTPTAMPSTYLIRVGRIQPELLGLWDGPVWQTAETLEVASFRPESSPHRPRTQARLLYDEETLYGIFRVQDKYVRCVHTEFQSQTYQDSCVEFFVQPKTDLAAYFNFEFNCGGALACSYINYARASKTYVMLTPGEGEQIRIYHSLPKVVDPEIQEDTLWMLEFAIPFSVLAGHVGPIGALPGQAWRANFYKCGDRTSHPHWASWMPVDELNFHLPRCFGMIQFEA